MRTEQVMPEIVETIDIRSSPERVFRALTTPSELARWWGEPNVCASIDWKLEPHVGAQWRSRWRWAETGAEFEIWGEVLAIDPPRLLMYSWHDERYPEVVVTSVRYDVTPTNEGCRVTVTHTGFSGETRDYADYRDGWAGVLAGLQRETEAASRSCQSRSEGL